MSTDPAGTAPTFAGGSASIRLDVNLLSGSTTLTLAYFPVGPANGGGQSIGDES